jgi:hypothetical protein
MDVDTATRFARIGLANIAREYPNQPGHLLTGPADLRAPRALHPVFYGSYDWHSSVHQHWMLVRLLRCVPALPSAADVRKALDERFGDRAVATEAAYVDEPQRRAFERPYGWAWLLALHAEAASGPPAGGWAARLAPLAAVLRERCLEWLALVYPQRSGVHANSAFATGLLLDAAAATADPVLRDAAQAAASRWYADDSGYPAWLEPSATDFLSPALVEADLMARVLDRDAFTGWFERFLPDDAALREPAIVPDRSDPHYVHLDGLNLSRAWCWRRIAATLPAGHPRRDTAVTAADRHAQASLPHVCSGEYVGEHWLPTFAVYLLTGGVADGPPGGPS